MNYNKILRINEAVFPTLSKIVNVQNKERIPDDDRPTVFYANHKNYLDPMYIIMAIQYHTKNDSLIVAPVYPAYMGFKPDKDFSDLVVKLGNKYFKKFLGSLGALPLFNRKDYSEKLAHESFEELCMMFEMHKRMLVFPEGRIEREKVKLPYKAGVVKLQQEAREVIQYVPIDIQYKSPLRKGLVYLNFGEPFDIILEMKDGNEVDGAIDKLEDKILELELEGEQNKRDLKYYTGFAFTKSILLLEPIGKYIIKKTKEKK